jgi:hypothetical protein
MYDLVLAVKVLRAAELRFPDPIANLADLQAIVDAPGSTAEDLLQAVDALWRLRALEIQVPVETGVDKVLRNFVNMRTTAEGRDMLKAAPRT